MDYFGKIVNKAARISGAAYGGQVLTSEEGWLDISKDAALACTLKAVPLASMSFKGIKEETNVIQVDIYLE